MDLKPCFPTLKCMANKQDGKQSQALFYFYEAGNVLVFHKSKSKDKDMFDFRVLLLTTTVHRHAVKCYWDTYHMC